MAKEKMDVAKKKCTTPEFRVSFPNVFKAKAFDEGDEPKYSVAMLFKKNADLSELKRAAKNALIEEFGPKENWPSGLDMPFWDGNDKEELEGYADMIVVNAKSKTRPGLIDRDKSPITEEDDAFYAGCYARATLIAYGFKKGKNKGVAFALQNIQKLRDGEKFSGKHAAEDDFDDLNDADTNSESDDSDDELGF